MDRETKQCQNCKKDFTIEPEDFEFYEKIHVPTPSWCPECRLQRRVIWRNDIILYKVKDSRTNNLIFSMFSPDAPIKIWEKDDWFSDIWDSMRYGKEYDFSRPFFEQLKELIQQTPWPSRSIQNLVNSDYSNNATNLKNCYLVFGSTDTENSYYSYSLSSTKDCFDCSYINGGEINYEGFINRKCYRAFFSSQCEDSHNIMFCKDCVGVSNCFGCVSLRHKSYYIFNCKNSSRYSHFYS